MKNSICNFLSILISLIALVVVSYKLAPLEWDWVGVLVGILSLLTTVLIGFQILQLLNINSIRREILEERDKIRKEQSFANAEVYLEVSEIFINTSITKRWYYTLKAANAALSCENVELLQRIEKYLEEQPFSLSGMDRNTRKKLNSALFGFDITKLRKIGHFPNIEGLSEF